MAVFEECSTDEQMSLLRFHSIFSLLNICRGILDNNGLNQWPSLVKQPCSCCGGKGFVRVLGEICSDKALTSR